MLNNMNIIRNIIIFIAAAAVLAACHGTDDTTSRPVLTVDNAEIDLATDTKVTFAVTFDGADVTSASHIYSAAASIDLEGAVFEPAQPGEYVFEAEYEGLVSDPVSVKVVNSRPQVDSKFNRHVSVIEFTGTWCAMCPQGFTTMNATLQSSDRYKKYVHVVALHDSDEYTIPATAEFFSYCTGIFPSLAYPSFATDLRDANLLTGEGASAFSKSLRNSFNEYKPHCGVAVSSSLTGSGKQAEGKVKVESEFTADYRVIVFVVEDRITGYQFGVQGYPDGQDDYLHRHVARKLVTSYGISGEKLGDNAMIPAGEEAEASWTFDVDPAWNLQNTEIYALAIDSNGYVNNMNVCQIDGGDSGYDTK